MKPIAWKVKYRQYGFDCARLFDNEGEALHHVRHLRLRNEVSIIYGIQRLGLIDEISFETAALPALPSSQDRKP